MNTKIFYGHENHEKSIQAFAEKNPIAEASKDQGRSFTKVKTSQSPPPGGAKCRVHVYLLGHIQGLKKVKTRSSNSISVDRTRLTLSSFLRNLRGVVPSISLSGNRIKQLTRTMFSDSGWLPKPSFVYTGFKNKLVITR